MSDYDPFGARARQNCLNRVVAKFHTRLVSLAREIDADIRGRGFAGMGFHPKVADAFRSIGIVVDEVLAFEARAADYQRERWGATRECDPAAAWSQEDEQRLLDRLEREGKRLPERLVSQANRLVCSPESGHLRDLAMGCVNDLSHRVRQAYAEGRARMGLLGQTPPVGPKTTPIVFISSTIEDLEQHRAKARDAINQVGFVPRMKEYFAARGDKGPLAVCLEKVSGSATEPPADVVVLIVAHRYGWVPEDQPGSDRKSITWLECEKARENGKEVLAFVVKRDHPWPDNLREEHQIAEEVAKGMGTSERLAEVRDNVVWLGKFKAWIDSLDTRVTFTTPESLHGAVLAALYEWQKRHLNDVA